MPAVNSTMLPLGTDAPFFSLPDPAGNNHGLSDAESSDATLVMFICNHCPFVQHLRSELTLFTDEYLQRNVAIFAINSNDTERYPGDGPEEMKKEISAQGYCFPYLIDEDQTVAMSYEAACTPDFFLFDCNLKLVYRGQFDASRPGNSIPVTGVDLREALDAILSGSPVSENQTPSIGCSIKWKPANQRGQI
jgi:peroxiredoxin